MTARLPIPGSDDGTWGDILNAYLEVSLASDGTLNSNVVGTSKLQDNAVTNAKLDSSTQATLASVAGKYTKPAGGIPSTDMTSAVQTSLGKADSSVQSSQLGAANGVATLNGSSQLVGSQIPSAVEVGSQQALGNLGVTATLTLTSNVTQATGTLTSNCALTVAGLTTGCSVTLLLTQDSTGGRTLTVNGFPVTVTSTANQSFAVQFYSPDGSSLYIVPPGPTAFPPSGSAGGSLAGSYPNPTIASSVSLPGNPTTTTQSALDNSTNVATTAYTDGAVTAIKSTTVYAPQMPDLVAPAANGGSYIGGSGASAPGSLTPWIARVVIPKTGTLHDLSIYITTSSGNLVGAIYDTGDTTPGVRTQKYSSGSVVCGAGTAWQKIGDPALSVTQGQQFDFYIVFDNGTAAIARSALTSAAMLQLPTSFFPAAGGASPKLTGTTSAIANLASVPTSIAEANITNTLNVPVIIARIA